MKQNISFRLIITLVLLSLLLNISYIFTKGVKRTPAEEQAKDSYLLLSSQNDYIKVILDPRTGSFDEAADPWGGLGWCDLTYGWGEDLAPPWDYQIYAIDDDAPYHTYIRPGINDGPGCEQIPGPDDSYTLYDPFEGSDIIYTIWDSLHGVKVVQTLQAVSLGGVPGINEQIKFSVMFIPVDDTCHNCGALKFYDTRLNTSDGAPISTSFGYNVTASIFYSPDIPAIWRAYETGYPPTGGLEALGILTGFAAAEPDVFWYGDWSRTNDNGWGDAYWTADVGRNYGDSAAMIKWYQRNVCPGDTLSYTTYYGIGRLEELTLYFRQMLPQILPECDQVSPNPARIQATVINGAEDMAHDVEVKISMLNPELTIAGQNPVIYDSIAGFGGTETPSWTIELDSTAYDDSVCYQIRCAYDEGPESTVTYCFYVPAPISVDANAFSFDTVICTDIDSIDLFAEATGNSGGYIYQWVPESLIAEPEGSRVKAHIPRGVTTFKLEIIDSNGCYDRDSITIIVDRVVADAGRDTTVYFGDSVEIGGHPAADSGVPPYTCLWQPSIELSNDTITNPKVHPSSNATRTYVLEVIDSLGCSDIDSVTVQIILSDDPISRIIRPSPGSFSSCPQESIAIAVTDSNGIIPDSIRLQVNGEIYSIPEDSELSFVDGSLLVYHPAPPFQNGEVVTVALLAARDSLQLPLMDTLTWSFTMDLEAPGFEVVAPALLPEMLETDEDAWITINIKDTLSGLDTSSLQFKFQGVTYDDGDYALIRYSDTEFRLSFNPSGLSIPMPEGESISFSLSATDSTDYCIDNRADSIWYFFIKPPISCFAHPNPFSPNGDNINDYVTFDYPYMFDRGAKIYIFNLRNVKVWESEVEAVSSMTDYSVRSWTGKDTDAQELPAGIYLYIIESDGEVLCKGTIILTK